MKTLSQTALYGEILGNEERYHQDIADLPSPTLEEEQVLIEQARAGDRDARDALLLSCLGYIKTVARKYAVICAACGNKRIEYLDLVQVGNLTLLECFDKAIVHPCPYGYLKRAAAGGIIKYCQKHASLITSPSERGGTILPMVPVASLDVPAFSQEGESTVGDLLAAPSPTSTDGKDFSVLYRVLERLTRKQHDVIVRHYGIDCAPVDLFTLSCEMRRVAGKPFKESANAAYSLHRSAVVKLRKQLERIV
jgi:hypothetical protein